MNMYRLLPEKYIHILERQYRIRLTAVFLWLLTFIVVVGIISLFPSYLLLHTQTKELDSQLVTKRSAAYSDDEKKIEAKLKETKKILGYFSPIDKNFQPFDFVQLINKNRVPGVVVYSFEIKSNGADAAEVAILGVADTRDILISFQKNLEKDPKVTKVVLPISDLAKSKNIDFSITISTK